MEKKSFLTISKEECREAALAILENSEKQWRNSKKLSETEDYGGAISYAIISIEELTKALILSLDGWGFNFRQVKGIKTFFSNHELRYVLAYILFIMSVFGSELVKLINKFVVEPELSFNFIRGIEVNDPHYEVKFKQYVLRKIVELRKELLWFSKIDLARQSGFYTDFHDNLKSPLAISKREFEVVFNKLNRVRIASLSLIESLNKEANSNTEPLEEMRVEFNKNNYYIKIEQLLSKMRTSKKRPFDFLTSQFKFEN